VTNRGKAVWGRGEDGAEGGGEATTRSYNSALQKLARDGDMKGCNLVLEQMEATEMRWDVFTYNAVLNCQSKARKLPTAEPDGLLAKMEQDKVGPNCTYTYTYIYVYIHIYTYIYV